MSRKTTGHPRTRWIARFLSIFFVACFALLAACGGGGNNKQKNPVPVLTSLSPNSVAAGSAAFTLSVNGSGFVSGSVVNWNGSSRTTTYVSATQLAAAIAAGDVATAGTAQVTVLNPQPGGGTSAPILFTVNRPVPAISSLSPSGGVAGGDAFALTVAGTGFVSTSVISWNGHDLPTTYVSGMELTGSVSHADLDRLGAIPVTVSNPPPMGGRSQPASFNVGGVLLASPGTGSSTADAPSGASAVSASGRFIAFASGASNLVDGDANGVTDVFLRDTCTGASDCEPSTRRMSLSSGGAEGNQASGLTAGDPETGPAVSGNGRYVAFVSAATNLVSGDTNGREDVFVRDTCVGAGKDCVPATQRVSVGTDGSQAGAPSSQPAISRDGRYVAFASPAENLVPGDTNGKVDVFLRDTCAGADATCNPTTRRASLAHEGTQGLGDSMQPALGADGRYVAYASTAGNLVVGDTNDAQDVFLSDTCIAAPSGCVAATIRLSLEGSDKQLDGASGYPALSGDARHVAFVHVAYASDTSSLTDPDGQGQLWLRDTCIDVGSGCNPSGTQAAAYGHRVSVSDDGRYLAFSSPNSLLPGDHNGEWDVFLRDSCRDAGTSCFTDTYRLSVDFAGLEVAGPSREPAISGDGRFVAFQSEASTLIPGGVDARGVANVYVTAAASRDQSAVPHYTVVELKPLTSAVDVNNQGDVVGEASGQAAVLTHDGQLKTLGTLGGSTSRAEGINDLFDIVGSSDTPSGVVHAFLYRNGVMLDLGTLGGRNSGATDISESGDIVGASDTASGGTHAFLYRDGKMLDLGTLGGANSYASAVNNAGDIVGSSDTASGARHAFLFKNGVMLDLGTLGGLNSGASDINDSGVVVGGSDTTTELWPGGCCGSDAFIYRNGAMVGYGCGSQRCSASSINEAGDIVGSASYGYFPGATRIIYYGWSSRGWVLDPTRTFYFTAAIVINDAGQIIVGADLDWPHASSPHRTADVLLDPVR